MKKLIAVILTVTLLCLGLTACGRNTSFTSGDGENTAKPNSQASDKTDSGIKVEGVDFDKPIFAQIVIKNYGTITVELDHESAPITVENFVKLSKEGFYDGLTFHRIMEGFMMQGGDKSEAKRS